MILARDQAIQEQARQLAELREENRRLRADLYDLRSDLIAANGGKVKP